MVNVLWICHSKTPKITGINLKGLSYYPTSKPSLFSDAVIAAGVTTIPRSDAKLAEPLTAQEATKYKTGIATSSCVLYGAGGTSQTPLSYYCRVEQSRKLVIYISRRVGSSFLRMTIYRLHPGSDVARL